MGQSRRASQEHADAISHALANELLRRGWRLDTGEWRPGAAVEWAPGWSQVKVAEKVGVVQPVLSKLLSASGSLGLDALLKVREFCGVPLDDLLRLSPLPERDDRVLKAAMALLVRTGSARPSGPPAGDASKDERDAKPTHGVPTAERKKHP